MAAGFFNKALNFLKNSATGLLNGAKWVGEKAVGAAKTVGSAIGKGLEFITGGMI